MAPSVLKHGCDRDIGCAAKTLEGQLAGGLRFKALQGVTHLLSRIEDQLPWRACSI